MERKQIRESMDVHSAGEYGGHMSCSVIGETRATAVAVLTVAVPRARYLLSQSSRSHRYVMSPVARTLKLGMNIQEATSQTWIVAVLSRRVIQ